MIFPYKASSTYPETFIELYDRTMTRIDAILTIKDQASFNIELNKLRKDLEKLINDHFQNINFTTKITGLQTASAQTMKHNSLN